MRINHDAKQDQFQSNHRKARRIKDMMDNPREEERRSYKLSDDITLNCLFVEYD